jgi:hypothetical protein
MPSMDGFSHILMLHGLTAISWDLSRRDQTSLGLVGYGIESGSWRSHIANAYDNWKTSFDAFCSVMSASHSTASMPCSQSSSCRILEDFRVQYSALYHAAQIVLWAEILDLQIYAGARHILGRPVSRLDFTRSQDVVKNWASDPKTTAGKAIWHAAHVIQEAETWDPSLADLFHYPWTMFLASLTLWTYFHARPLSGSQTGRSEEMIWDAKQSLRRVSRTITATEPERVPSLNFQSGENPAAGMTAVIVKHLSKIRWGVVYDGVLVLKGLVPWRLIVEEQFQMRDHGT